jgi:hypothetical protein
MLCDEATLLSTMMMKSEYQKYYCAFRWPILAIIFLFLFIGFTLSIGTLAGVGVVWRRAPRLAEQEVEFRLLQRVVCEASCSFKGRLKFTIMESSCAAISFREASTYSSICGYDTISRGEGNFHDQEILLSNTNRLDVWPLFFTTVVKLTTSSGKTFNCNDYYYAMQNEKIVDKFS